MLRRTVSTISQMTLWFHLRCVNLSKVDNEGVKVLMGCNAPETHEIKERSVVKSSKPHALRTPLGSAVYVPGREITKKHGYSKLSIV